MLYGVVDRSGAGLFHARILSARVRKMFEETECAVRLEPAAGAFRSQGHELAVWDTRIQKAGQKGTPEKRKQIESIGKEHVLEIRAFPDTQQISERSEIAHRFEDITRAQK